MIDSSVEAAVAKTSALIGNSLKSAPVAAREITARLAAAHGKFYRARLLLMCAAREDGEIADSAVKAAAAAELFHLATLVHDDIIDDAPTRRGIASTHAVFGAKRAVIAGDYILVCAMRLISDIPLPDGVDAERFKTVLPVFVRAMSEVCLGELKQTAALNDFDLSVTNYLRIISGKTAALFSLCARAGAILGGADTAEERACASFGRCLGLIFQIADDCKDYEQRPSDAGKPTGRDFAAGVVTLPLIMALIRNPEIREITATAELVARVRESGGCAEAKKLADRFERKASNYLAKIVPHKRAALEKIIKNAKSAT